MSEDILIYPVPTHVFHDDDYYFTFTFVVIEMDPRSKQDVIRCEPLNSEEIWTDCEKAAVNGDDTPTSLSECGREVGGVVLRGNRVVLVRSLTNDYQGVRIPSLSPRGTVKTAVFAEVLISTRV